MMDNPDKNFVLVFKNINPRDAQNPGIEEIWDQELKIEKPGIRIQMYWNLSKDPKK